MKFKQVFLTLWMFLFSIICIGCSNKITSTNDELEIGEDEAGFYYMDVIDGFSSILYDYENPNFSYSSLNSLSNVIYVLDGNETHNLISAFNNILLYSIDSEIAKSIDSNMDDALYIEVSFSFVGNDNCSTDGIGHFYILKNGRLVFDDNRNCLRFYSKAGKLDFEEMKNKIMGCSNYLKNRLNVNKTDVEI